MNIIQTRVGDSWSVFREKYGFCLDYLDDLRMPMGYSRQGFWFGTLERKSVPCVCVCEIERVG